MGGAPAQEPAPEEALELVLHELGERPALEAGLNGGAEGEQILLDHPIEGRLLGAPALVGRARMITDLPPTPLVVRGSESQLARAVDNLIRNAVEAIGGNGEVVVKSAKIDVL